MNTSSTIVRGKIENQIDYLHDLLLKRRSRRAVKRLKREQKILLVK